MNESADKTDTVDAKQSLNGDRTVRLIEILRDGQELYATASERTDDPYIRQLCVQMVSRRESACVRLGPFANSTPADVPTDATLRGKAETVWTDFKALLGDTDDVFLATLMDVEVMTIAKINEAREGLPDGPARDLVDALRKEFEVAMNSVESARPVPNETSIT